MKKKINIIYIPNLIEQYKVHDIEVKNRLPKNCNYISLDYLKKLDNNSTLKSISKYLYEQIKNIESNNNILILDSFATFFILDIIDIINKKIEKIIFINPLNKTIYLKNLTIRSFYFPTTFKEMMYKQMKLIYNFDQITYDKNWVNLILDELQLGMKYYLVFRNIFTEIFTHSNIKRYFLFLKNSVSFSSLIIPDNSLICESSWSLKYYKNYDIHVIAQCGHNFLIDSKEKYFIILNNIITKYCK